MTKQCLQALNNGEQCNAPAINGSHFCRHHDPQTIREQLKTKSRDNHPPFALPLLQDKSSVLHAINEVLRALADRLIKRSEADTFIHGIKFAARVIAEIEQSGGAIESGQFNSAAPVPGSRPESRNDDAYRSALLDLDEFLDTMQNGTPEQLIEQIKAKQPAGDRNRDGAPKLAPIALRPTEQALAHLAASHKR